MSNLIKSGFIAFSQNEKLVIDANKNDIIRGIDSVNEELAAGKEKSDSMEEALAEALIRDVGLDGEENDVLTMELSDMSSSKAASEEQLQKIAEGILISAKQEAEGIVSKAHDEAEHLRASAFEEAENVKEEARQEGFQAGYEQGQEKAQGELNEKLKEIEQEKQEFEEHMVSQEKKLISKTEGKMVELICQLIPTITGVVIENQKSVLFYMVNAAMRDLENSKHFVIKVSSDDYEDLYEKKDEIYGALNPNIEIELFEDAKLSALQCIIETDNGLVDVSLDVQLDNLNKALKLMVQE